MAYVIIKTGNSYDHGSKHKEFQIESLSTDSDASIQAELAVLPDCAPGSIAINQSFDVICNKNNDGTWTIIK